MDSDVITLAVDLIQGFAVFDGSGKIPCSINGDKRVISVYFHSQMCGRVCYHGTNGTKSDDTKFLATDLASCKLFLLFFSKFVNVFFIFFMCYPFNTANDITRSKKHTCKNKFFYTVCVGTRCIEYYDTLFCAFVYRNIVDTCTCTSDNFYIFRKFHFVHFGTSNKNGVCVIQFLCLFVIFSKQAETCLGNRIEAFILEHYAFSSSNFFMNATRASTPSFGIAL